MREEIELRDALDRAVHDAGGGGDLVGGAVRRGRRRVRVRAAVAVASVAAVALVGVPVVHDLAGGASSALTASGEDGVDPDQGTRGAQGCYPAPLVVDPVAVEPGGTVALSSPAAGCDLGYEEGARYEISFLGVDGSGTGRVASTPVAPDGSFTTEVTVPGNATAGEARFDAGPTVYDQPCEPGPLAGTIADCVTYSAPVVVTSEPGTAGGLEAAGRLLATRLADGTRVAVAAPQADAGYPEALVSGRLAVGQNGCLVLDRGEEAQQPPYVLVMPVGVTVTADGTGLDVPGVGVVRVGDSVTGGGGYSEDIVLEGPLAPCGGPVVSINPDLELGAGRS